MGNIENRLNDLGYVLPPELTPPPGIVLPFQFVRISGDRAWASGHGPQAPDGSIAQPLGKIGDQVSEDEAYRAAQLTALSMLGSLQRALGSLDRITGWARVYGMVNAVPGFSRQPNVINGFSDLILEVFGPDVGAHSRSAVGMADLPFQIPVEVEAELLIKQ
jgi:enamine deaminase RidA (YjgF/YER057c/UK114 family)